MQLNYILWSVACAIIIAFWITWVLARHTPLQALRGWPLTLAVHGLAALIFFAFIGWFKAYGSLFAYREALIVVPAQIVWILVDFTLGGFTRHRRYRPGSAR
ncbi:hypothetical protein ACOYW6_08015 [Parablastomonas sp. CN1-191]|uniref:hypothetical protein n=1 Tax=Parablastomonas sp. CN1-191 TaxID=3400908 RepID=UPI003BF7AA6D